MTAQPIACSLAPADLPARVGAWRQVLAGVVERTDIDGGVRLVLDAATPLDELLRLVTAEHDCCRFFSFALTVDHRGRALEVTAPAEASDLVDALFG